MITWTETDTLFIVPWPEVERRLGRPHAYTAEDDEALAAAMVAAGAPAYVTRAPGFFSDEGWCLERRPDHKPPPAPPAVVRPRGSGPYR
jgi:hypothetical protein